MAVSVSPKTFANSVAPDVACSPTACQSQTKSASRPSSFVISIHKADFVSFLRLVLLTRPSDAHQEIRALFFPSGRAARSFPARWMPASTRTTSSSCSLSNESARIRWRTPSPQLLFPTVPASKNRGGAEDRGPSRHSKFKGTFAIMRVWHFQRRRRP